MSSVVGGFSGGVTAYESGKEQERLAYQQGDYLLAQGVEQRADIETKRLETVGDIAGQLKTVVSREKAAYGAHGVTAEGSPSEVILKTGLEAQKAINRTNYWSNLSSARNLEWTSAQVREIYAAGRLARKAGTMSMIGSFAQGTASLIQSGASILSGMGSGGVQSTENTLGGSGINLENWMTRNNSIMGW